MKFNNDFLFKLLTCIETEVLKPDAYVAWCDKQIADNSSVPLWVIDVSVSKSFKEAVSILKQAAYKKLNETWNPEDYGWLWVACQFKRYRQKELPWAEFLDLAAEYASYNNSGWYARDFDALLDSYTKSNYEESVEKNQSDYFEEIFVENIEDADSFLSIFT